LDDKAPFAIPENPLWLNPKPTLNFELRKYKIKLEGNPFFFNQHFS
jgi:hypothetical protein